MNNCCEGTTYHSENSHSRANRCQRWDYIKLSCLWRTERHWCETLTSYVRSVWDATDLRLHDDVHPDSKHFEEGSCLNFVVQIMPRIPNEQTCKLSQRVTQNAFYISLQTAPQTCEPVFLLWANHQLHAGAGGGNISLLLQGGITCVCLFNEVYRHTWSCSPSMLRSPKGCHIGRGTRTLVYSVWRPSQGHIPSWPQCQWPLPVGTRAHKIQRRQKGTNRPKTEPEQVPHPFRPAADLPLSPLFQNWSQII